MAGGTLHLSSDGVRDTLHVLLTVWAISPTFPLFARIMFADSMGKRFLGGCHVWRIEPDELG